MLAKIATRLCVTRYPALLHVFLNRVDIIIFSDSCANIGHLRDRTGLRLRLLE